MLTKSVVMMMTAHERIIIEWTINKIHYYIVDDENEEKTLNKIPSNDNDVLKKHEN